MEREISIHSDYIYRILHQLYLNLDEMLIPYDITHQQARIILHIYQKEKYGKESCQKDLERLMGLRGSSITSLLQGLEKRGFIERKKIEGDARKKEIFLSEKGKKLIDVFHRIFSEGESNLLEVMSEEEQIVFLDVLKRIVMNLESKQKVKVKR